MAKTVRTEHLRHAVTQYVTADGVQIAYREVGGSGGLPLVALNHLGANLDDWDPRIVDGLATGRRVILIGYRGVGRSGGKVRGSIEDMAADVISAVRALGLRRFDLFGLSMGGMVAQEIVAQSPELVERLILVSSGPAGGPELTRMTRVMVRGTVRASLSFSNPKVGLFFTRTAAGKDAARAYLKRLRERDADRDARVGVDVLRVQLAAVRRWGERSPSAAARFNGPVLIIHGDSDRMVPVANARALVDTFSRSSLMIFPDAGHGVVFQNHRDVVAETRAFLRR